MTNNTNIRRSSRRQREFPFIPRVINPVKINKAIIFSADEQVRKTKAILNEKMPWIDVEILSDPMSVSSFTWKDASVMIFDDLAMTIIDADKIRRTNRDVVLVLLSANHVIHCSPPSVAQAKFPYSGKADFVFAINQSEFLPEHIITAVVRCAEDRLNIEKYSEARRHIFLIVDDEPRWFSQFLPVLYDIIGQRADVMITRTYEETLQFIFGVEKETEIDAENYVDSGHGYDVVCLITDIFFPKGDNLDSDAGRSLVRLINQYYSRIPIIIASKAEQASDLSHIAFLMPKGDPGSIQTLEKYIHDFTGMGDFLIRQPSGNVHRRVRNLHELWQVILKAENDDSEGQEIRSLLEGHGQKDHFSTWLYMHGFQELGDKLRPRQDRGKRLVTILKRYIRRELLRMEDTPLIIDGVKIYNLTDLLDLLRQVDPLKIQKFSDNDIFSYWLDRKGYPELAEAFRPIHGSGKKLKQALIEIVEKWMTVYQTNS